MDADAWAKMWSTITWGSVPDWIAAIGTVAAFVVAAVAYVWSVGLSRKQQARMVSLDEPRARLFGPGGVLPSDNPMLVVAGAPARMLSTAPPRFEVTGQIVMMDITIRNRSDEVMGPVQIAFSRQGTETFIEGAVYPLGRVQPGSEETVHVAMRDVWHPNYPSLRVRIVFRDSAGRWWQRFENERVSRAPRRIRPREDLAAQARALSRVPAEHRQPQIEGQEWELSPLADGLYRATKHEEK